jgi:hypothetical protein
MTETKMLMVLLFLLAIMGKSSIESVSDSYVQMSSEMGWKWYTPEHKRSLLISLIAGVLTLTMLLTGIVINLNSIAI